MLQVFLNDDCLLEETREYSSNNCSTPVKLVLSNPVKIKPNKRWLFDQMPFMNILCSFCFRYDITTELTGGPTLYGRNAQKVNIVETVILYFTAEGCFVNGGLWKYF